MNQFILDITCRSSETLYKVALNSSMSSNLEYFIKDSKSYPGDVGQVDHIMIQNSMKMWRSEFDMAEIKLILALKHPSVISSIQLKGFFTEKIQITLFDEKSQQQKTESIEFPQGQECVKSLKFQEKILTNSVELVLSSSDGTAKRMGLNFCLIRGEPVTAVKAPEKLTNLSKEHDFSKHEHLEKQKAEIPKPNTPYQNLYQKTLRSREKGIFNSRIKSTHRPQTDKLVNEVQNDSQLQRAIKQSEFTYQKEQKQIIGALKHRQHKNDKMEVEIESSETEFLSREQNGPYHKFVQLREVEHFTKNVNQRWLEAQRRLEQKCGCREEDRISNCIQIKYLSGKKILIDKSITGQKRTKIESMAESMGANIISSAQDYCFIIATSLDKPSVQSAIKMKGVKAINENYIFECRKVNACLDYKQYMLKK